MISFKFSQNVQSLSIGSIFTKGVIKGILCGPGRRPFPSLCVAMLLVLLLLLLVRQERFRNRRRRARSNVCVFTKCAPCSNGKREAMTTTTDGDSKRGQHAATGGPLLLHPNSRNSISRNVEPMELCCKIDHMWIFINCVPEFGVHPRKGLYCAGVGGRRDDRASGHSVAIISKITMNDILLQIPGN